MKKYIPQFEPNMKLKYAVQVTKQILSSWVGYGKTTKTVEKIFNEINGRYNLLTTSGTTALMMAIKALDLPEKSTILFPAYTFLAGANAAKFLGYNVRLVDINENTLCMDPDKIELTSDVSAVMFVDHNGYTFKDLSRVHNICFKNNIPLIEDSSQAFTMPNGGEYGDISVLSFSVPKIITSGQGGLVSTNNINYYEKLKQIIDHGGNWRKDKLHDNDGVNFKFNDILSSLLYSQLLDINSIYIKKKKVFDEYRKYIYLIDYGYEYSWMVLYRTKKAKQIISKLELNGIQATQYYRPLNHNLIYKTENSFPIAEKVYNEVVYLPSSSKLTKKQIQKICKIIIEVEKND